MAKSTNSSTAAYGTKAGTATYGTNAGTSNYAKNAGTANYSKNGASATYSSTATYAKNVASHNHDDYFSKDKNTKIDIVLNSIVKPGIYQVYCTEGVNTAENNYDYPEGSSGVLTVIRTNTGSSSTVIRQTYYRYGTVDSTDYGIYTRQIQVGGTIGTWIKVITAKDFVVSNGVLTLKFL